MSEKIQLRAVMLKDSTLKILDQDDREFDFVPPYTPSGGKDIVQIDVSISTSNWPFRKPRCEVTFSVPLDVATPELERRIAEVTGKL